MPNTFSMYLWILVRKILANSSQFTKFANFPPTKYFSCTVYIKMVSNCIVNNIMPSLNFFRGFRPMKFFMRKLLRWFTFKTLILTLKQRHRTKFVKYSWKILAVLLKTAKTCESLAQWIFPHLRYIPYVDCLDMKHMELILHDLAVLWIDPKFPEKFLKQLIYCMWNCHHSKEI